MEKERATDNIHLPVSNTYTMKLFLGDHKMWLFCELILEEVKAFSYLDIKSMG